MAGFVAFQIERLRDGGFVAIVAALEPALAQLDERIAKLPPETDAAKADEPKQDAPPLGDELPPVLDLDEAPSAPPAEAPVTAPATVDAPVPSDVATKPHKKAPKR